MSKKKNQRKCECTRTKLVLRFVLHGIRGVYMTGIGAPPKCNLFGGSTETKRAERYGVVFVNGKKKRR